MTTEQTLSLHQHVAKIANLLAFAKRSEIPYRTLNRIKGDPEYPMSHTTRLALASALKRIKPALRKESKDA